MPSKIQKENLKKIEKRKALVKKTNKFLSANFKWFVVMLSLSIIAFGYFKILKPKYELTRETLDRTNQDQQQDYYARKRELEKITNAVLTFSKVTPDYMEKIRSVAPSDISRIFTEINKIFVDNGLLINSLTINEIDARDPKIKKTSKEKDYFASGDIGKLNISTAVMGADYESFKRLLVSLENHLRLVDVQSLSFDPVNRVTSLSMVTYFNKETE